VQERAATRTPIETTASTPTAAMATVTTAATPAATSTTPAAGESYGASRPGGAGACAVARAPPPRPVYPVEGNNKRLCCPRPSKPKPMGRHGIASAQLPAGGGGGAVKPFCRASYQPAAPPRSGGGEGGRRGRGHFVCVTPAASPQAAVLRGAALLGAALLSWGNVVGGLAIPLAPGAHIPWRLWRGSPNAATPGSDLEWLLVRQGPAYQHTGACALRGLKRSCASAKAQLPPPPAGGVLWPHGRWVAL
jgi:hypothetical protein